MYRLQACSIDRIGQHLDLAVSMRRWLQAVARPHERCAHFWKLREPSKAAGAPHPHSTAWQIIAVWLVTGKTEESVCSSNSSSGHFIHKFEDARLAIA
jgi:hypothetical protein